MLDRFTPSRTTLSRFAVGCAWFFIVVSLAHLLWVIGTNWGDPAGTTKLYHAIVDGHSYDAWGLTYTNTSGLLLAIAQLLVVSAAAAASALPWQRTWRFRRIGHGVLCAWAGLWALNLLWLASVDTQLDSFAQATLLCLLAGCTGYRAVKGWSPGRSSLLPPIESAGGNEPTGDAPPAGFESPADPSSPPESSDDHAALLVDCLERSVAASGRTNAAAATRPIKKAVTLGRKLRSLRSWLANLTRKAADRLRPTTGT